MSRSTIFLCSAIALLGLVPRDAHANWLTSRIRQVAAQRGATKASVTRANEEAEQSARRQRAAASAGRTSSDHGATKTIATNALRDAQQLRSLAEQLGGSRRNPTHVSSIKQMLVQRGFNAGNAPLFGFRTAYRPAYGDPSSRGPSVFTFSQL